MSKFLNEGTVDRFIRLFLALGFFLGAYFWVGGAWQWVLSILAIVSLFTSLTGFCLLYKVCGINTVKSEAEPWPNYVKIILVLLLLTAAVAGSYYSVFFTKKFFLEDFNHMNNFYKQTLFFTGQDNREEAVTNYNELVVAYQAFHDKYSSYLPYSLRQDAKFSADLETVSDTITQLKDGVYIGDLQETHLGFESIRPIFQDILKRNNFSLLSVALVDFHDSMEKIIDAANASDAVAVIATYPEVNEKLTAVETIVNDAEIGTIRTALEDLLFAANNDQPDTLHAKAANLKSAFVKVYLVRG